MTRQWTVLVAAAAAVLGIAATSAGAQTDTSVAAYRDWSVFTPTNPRECYIVSPPVETEARRGGQTVSVNRSEIRLFVIIRPSDDPAEAIDQQVAFTGGYPFRAGSTVEMEIGDQNFSLVTGSGSNNEYAWPSSPEADRQVVAAMRAGVSAKVTGVSARGTTTIDTFSLLGFTAALDEADRLCE